MIRFLILALLAFTVSDIWGANVGRDSINDQEVTSEERVLEDSIPESFIERLDYYYNGMPAAGIVWNMRIRLICWLTGIWPFPVMIRSTCFV